VVLRGLRGDVNPREVVKAGGALQQCSRYVRVWRSKLPELHEPIFTLTLGIGMHLHQ